MKLPRALLLTLATATTTRQTRAHVFRAVQEEENGVNSPGGDPVNIAPEVVEHDVIGSVLNYASFNYNVIYDGSDEGVPEFYNAQEILSEEGGDRVLGELTRAYGQLAWSVAFEGIRNLRSSKDGRALQMLQMLPVRVTDIACPEGLMYAPEGVYCLNFKLGFTPGEADKDAVAELSDLMRTAIDTDGRLYDIVKTNKADTVISGLGNPGKGIDYTTTVEDTSEGGV